MGVIEGYKQTEVGAVPEDWEVTNLESITDPKRTISYGIVQTGPNIPNGVRCLRVVDVNDGRINTADLITTSQSISDSYKRTILKAGDLVMPLRGKVGDAAIVDKELEGCNLTRGVALIAIRPDWSASYCRQFIASPATRTRLEQSMNGSALQEIPIATLRSFKIALPPKKTEQEAIAEALGDADALIESLEQFIAKKRHLKQGAMQELLTGKRRLMEFAPVKVGYKRTEVGVIPEDWKTSRLTSVADVRDGTHESPKYRRSGVPFVTSKNIVAGRIEFQDITFICEEDADEINRRSKVDRGDILMSMIGTVGNTALVDFEPDFCIKNVALIKPSSSQVDPEFLIHLFRSTQYGRYIETKLYGGIQKFISLGMMRDLVIPLPPTKSEQTAIAVIVSDMDAQIATLQAKLAKSRLIKQGMMHKLLTGKIRLV